MATAAAMMVRRTSKALVQYAWGVVGYNVLVILWGALVRATGSGAGCGNHWPLCNGQVIPLSPRVDTLIEFTHRCMTGGATFIVLGLLVWTFRATVKGQAARVMAVASLVLLLNEALLGALLVKLGYVTGNQSMGRVVVLSIHLSNTLLLLAALTLTAVLLGTGQMWRELGVRGGRKLWASLGLAATLVVGVSGSLAALGDTLFPASSLRAAFAQDFAAGSPWLLRLRGVHPVSAVIAAVFVLWLVGQARRAAGGTGQACWGGAASGLRRGVAGVPVCAWASGCSVAGAGVDADCASARGGFVLGGAGGLGSGGDLASFGIAYPGGLRFSNA